MFMFSGQIFNPVDTREQFDTFNVTWDILIQMYPELDIPLLTDYDEFLPKNNIELLGLRFEALTFLEWANFTLPEPIGKLLVLRRNDSLALAAYQYLGIDLLKRGESPLCGSVIIMIDLDSAELSCFLMPNIFHYEFLNESGYAFLLYNWNEFLVDLIIGIVILLMDLIGEENFYLW